MKPLQRLSSMLVSQSLVNDKTSRAHTPHGPNRFGFLLMAKNGKRGGWKHSCASNKKRPPSLKHLPATCLRWHQKRSGNKKNNTTTPHTQESHITRRIENPPPPHAGRCCCLFRLLIFYILFLWPNLLLHSMRSLSLFFPNSTCTLFYSSSCSPCAPWLEKETDSFHLFVQPRFFDSPQTALSSSTLIACLCYSLSVSILTLFFCLLSTIKRFRIIINYFPFFFLFLNFEMISSRPVQRWPNDGNQIKNERKREGEILNKKKRQRDQFGSNLIHARQRFLKRRI